MRFAAIEGGLYVYINDFIIPWYLFILDILNILILSGGTTWVCGIAIDKPDNFVERQQFETKDPISTLSAIKEWLLTKEFDAIGIASFGPIDAKLNSSKYG